MRLDETNAGITPVLSLTASRMPQQQQIHETQHKDICSDVEKNLTRSRDKKLYIR